MIDKLYGFQVSVYPTGELIVYDLTDPDDIIIKFRYPLAYLLMGSGGLIAKDGYLYVVGGSGGGALYTFDISDIDNITLLDTYHDDARLINGGGMCIRGNYLYISRDRKSTRLNSSHRR